MRRLPYIHERPDWPRFTWDSSGLASLLASVSLQRGRLLGKMESLGFQQRSEAGLRILTSEVVKSSAIEGESLDPAQVRSSIARKLGLDAAGLPKPTRAVDGVVMMMLDATKGFTAPLTADRLFGWHAALFPSGRSGMQRIVTGAWRTKQSGPMHVVSGSAGHETVHFEAPHADHIEKEMREFLAWFEAPPSSDPLVKAAIAHFWFVTIHPFEDGNGRIARAIAEMSLARADETGDRFYSMSSQIEVERKDYYFQLEAAQRGNVDVTAWLEWFLSCLGRSIANAETLMSGVLGKARFWQKFQGTSLNERQRRVVNIMLDDFEGFMSTSKYAKIAKCSTDTALRDIQDLVRSGILLQNREGGRKTSYRLVEIQA